MQPKSKFRHKFVSIPVSQLRLNHRLNRATRVGRIKWFVKNMDLDMLGPFAAWRDGPDLWVIDGQHRKAGLEQLGMGDTKVDCECIEGATFEDACAIFLARNNGLAVRAFDKFDKGVKAGFEDCVATKQIIERFGLEVGDQVKDGNLVCVAAARDVYSIDRGEALVGALDIAINAWGRTSAALDGNIVRGLGQFAAHYNGEVERDVLVKKLNKFQGGPGALVGQAKGQRGIRGGTVSRNVALIVVDLYNKGRRNGQLAPL